MFLFKDHSFKTMGNGKHRSGKCGSVGGYQKQRDFRRHTRGWTSSRVKLRENIGVIGTKKFLNLFLLNVDGLSPSTLEDVKSTLVRKTSDVCILLETKRRHEEIGCDIKIDGYAVTELRRSDVAGDRAGGGIAYYTRKSEGLIFQEESPSIADQSLHYVHNERFWVTTASVNTKTAICGLYVGCQYGDDRHGTWNDGIIATVQSEAACFRAKGFRVVFLGDFNAHIGSVLGQGVVGNHDDINQNGERFLRFLRDGSFCHINGEQNLTTGLWTRQRGNSKTILDYAVISSEHLSTVHGLLIDDQGDFGGGSDHNWLFLTLNDNFVKKHRFLNVTSKKKSWNNMDNVDWQPFQEYVAGKLTRKSPVGLTVDEMASFVSSTLLSAGVQCVGYKSTTNRARPKLLPRNLVDEIKLKRELESKWKTAVSGNISSIEDTARDESAFLEQKKHVDALLFTHNNRNRSKIKEICSGNTPRARTNFWRIVSTKLKQSMGISAVVDPTTGVLKCGIDEIKSETELHLARVFHGSFDPVLGDLDPTIPQPPPNDLQDHTYCVSPGPTLPFIDDSKTIGSDPNGWLNCVFKKQEVKKILKSLNGGKSAGWDTIPNEFLIHSPDLLAHWLTILFNKIKTEGVMPRGWNKGRITLIHKAGQREHLSNYRPITVIISLSGLFSKLLNSRLSEVVEVHNLLGEVQNGFRRERRMADNSFILDSILWKAKANNREVHLCYVDVVKAYDSVNRNILWRKLSKMGFGGDFLGCLQALYTGDSVDSVVNGVSTRPVYLGRGLRQGCSLSPLLFALYISEIGSDISQSSEGFNLGGVTFSGLLFADDVVLVSQSFHGLQSLIELMKSRCDDLKLEISEFKSKIVTPDGVDQLVLLDDKNEVTLSLKKVLSYKYLGTDTTLLMSSTGSKRQHRCILTAKRYKFACFYVARTGPDVIDTVLATWSNIAIPSMLTGCEVIPFSEATIEAIERTQAQMAKHALGLPQSTPNICAQTELGLKPFRLLLYQHQLNFYTRLLNLPHYRWARRALSDHLEGEWLSPYISYITKIRERVQMFFAPPSVSFLKLHLNAWAVNKTNLELSSLDLPCVSPIVSYTRQRYVFEHDGCSTIAEFKFRNAGLGNRAPRPGRQRSSRCPLCNGCLDEVHVAFICQGMDEFRIRHTDLNVFLTMCRAKGLYPRATFRLYLTGLDWNGVPVTTSILAKRGVTLKRLKTEWLLRS